MTFETGLLPNILGFLGVAINVVWPVFRGRTNMLVAQAAGAFAFGAHYLLVEAWTGSLMATLVGVQALVAIPLGTSDVFRRTYIGIIPVIALGMALTWHGPASAFAAAAMTLISVGRYQTNLLKFRFFLLVCIPFWTGHNLIVGSIPGLASDALSAASGAWMLWITWRQSLIVPA